MRKWPKKSLLLRKENDTHQAPQLVSLQNKINHHKWDVWISPLLQPPTCAGGCTSANPSNAKPSKGNGAGPASVRGWERSLRGPSLARGCVPQHCYQLTVCAGSPQHAHPATIVSHTPTPDTIFNHLAFWRS